MLYNFHSTTLQKQSLVFVQSYFLYNDYPKLSQCNILVRDRAHMTLTSSSYLKLQQTLPNLQNYKKPCSLAASDNNHYDIYICWTGFEPIPSAAKLSVTNKPIQNPDLIKNLKENGTGKGQLTSFRIKNVAENIQQIFKVFVYGVA